MTNGDKWRSMSDEQMAEIIIQGFCCNCPVFDETCKIEHLRILPSKEDIKYHCKGLVVKWLKQEAE